MKLFDKKNKKGIGNVVNMLYPAALALLLVSVVTGVAIIVLDKFGSTAGLSGTASGAVNASRTAIADIPNSWMSLIVTVTVLGIIIMIVLAAFGGISYGGGKGR